MPEMDTLIIAAIIILLFSRLIWETLLTRLNMQHVRRYRESPPKAVATVMDEATFRQAADYTLAKSRLSLFSNGYGMLVLLVVLFSGLLPRMYNLLVPTWKPFTLPDIPLDYYARFNLEARFGFNKSTVRLWVMDKFKGLVLSLIIGLPLIGLLLFLMQRLGPWWWVWAFGVVFLLMLVMMILYPMLILPWFNTLSPLPEGSLRTRLLELAQRTKFQAATIQVMDGSRRSGHANAFFTGFGRFRRIVLFDTLLEQLTDDELEAVLAHEIGHYQMGHVPRMLVLSAVMTLLGFALLALLLKTPAFITAFGFDAARSGPAPTLLLFGLLVGTLTFWLSPLLNHLSRRHEYAADQFSRQYVGADPMIRALRKLSRKNLSNLTPHPLYSAFYYSHPALLERETALQQ